MKVRCVRTEEWDDRLEVGKEYEATSCEIGSWSSDVYLEGFSAPFDSCYFDSEFQKEFEKAVKYFNDHYYDKNCLTFGIFIRDFWG